MTHIPVLLSHVVEAFHRTSLRVFLDGTVGAGGHAAALLQAHREIEYFLGLDRDPVALQLAGEKLQPWGDKVHLQKSNFAAMKDYIPEGGVDGILLDLGVSSMQLDTRERGFSFSAEAPLDMRMDPDNPLTAEEIINTWSQEDLGRLFRDYGEEKRWRLLAQVICRERQHKPIQTTTDLVGIVNSVAGPRRKKEIHPATLLFQALRIAVNEELTALERVLPVAIKALNPQGRLAVISFHSLEDRIVKETFRFAASDKVDTCGLSGLFLEKKPDVVLVTRKPIVATAEEISENPRCRSAKLRIVEKL